MKRWKFNKLFFSRSRCVLKCETDEEGENKINIGLNVIGLVNCRVSRVLTSRVQIFTLYTDSRAIECFSIIANSSLYK